MAKVIDITEKLNFDENPKLKIKGEEIEVNSDAKTVLKIMGISQQDNVGEKEIMEMYELLFEESEREKIDGLKLKFSDFQKVIKEAIVTISGEEEGE